MEYLLAVLGAIIGFLGYMLFNKRQITKTKEEIQDLKQERKEIEKKEIPQEVKKLDLDEAKKYWDDKL